MARGPALLVAVLLVVPAIGIAQMQPRLAKSFHEIKQRDDTYALPPPKHLEAMTLGYHAAAVDLLWAKLLVEYGTHWAEKRPFDARNYMDAIITIEPNYAPVYKYADTLLVYVPPVGTREDAYAARAYLERGLKERHGDYEVWQDYGQFMAFLGPAFLKDQSEKDEWRKIGANALLYAVELGADAQRSLAAATILRKYGEREASTQHLTRILAITDDEETRQQILYKLRQLEAAPDMDQLHAFEARWHQDYAFLSRTMFTLLGPRVDGARCAGVDALANAASREPGNAAAATSRARDCARDWPDALEAAQAGAGR